MMSVSQMESMIPGAAKSHCRSNPDQWERLHPASSESQPQLSLERAPSRLRCGQPEIVAVDAERRQCGCWMIQDVRGVHTNLERFAFRNPERLAKVPIESDRTHTLNRILSQRALSAR